MTYAVHDREAHIVHRRVKAQTSRGAVMQVVNKIYPGKSLAGQVICHRLASPSPGVEVFGVYEGFLRRLTLAVREVS